MTSLSRREFIKKSGIASATFALPFSIELLKHDQMKNNNIFDVIIVGGSYSGLAAGMALGRALRQVLIIDSGNPCNRQTPHSHNFLTQDGKTPEEIANLARQQVKKYDTVKFLNDLALEGVKTENGFEIRTEWGGKFLAKKLIFSQALKILCPVLKVMLSAGVFRFCTAPIVMATK